MPENETGQRGQRPIYEEALVGASLRLTDEERSVLHANGAQWFREQIDAAIEPEEREPAHRKSMSVKVRQDQREKLKRLRYEWVKGILAKAAKSQAPKGS